MNLKRTVTVSLAFFMLFGLIGCGNVKLQVNPFNSNAEYYGVDSEIAAENSLYAIRWDNENGGISFLDKASGNVWSTAPVGLTKEQITNPNFKAPIIVKYIENETYIDKTLNAFTNSVRKSSYSAEFIENGIQVTYYFEDAEISVPVCFVIGEDGFHMYIETAKIQENLNHIYSIAFMPFLAGVDNTLTSDRGYIFAPSGSGALIYPKSIGDGVGTTVTDEVYGRDCNNGYVDKVNPVNVKLPVFGSKTGDKGICGIIESGAENATLTYNVGSVNLGYSTVYPVFNIRGSLYCTLNVMNTSEQTIVYSDERIKNKISVLYTPLNNEKADYMGIAECYRNYLIKNKGLKEEKNETMLNLKIVGGVVAKKYTFGVPYDSLHVTTSFAEASDIISDLNEKTGEKINANLIGFSKTGISPGKIADGYTYNGKFGNIRTLESIKKKADLFFDFDIITCASEKLSIFGSNTSLNLSKKKQLIQQVDFVTSGEDVSAKSISLVSRDKLGGILAKAVDRTKQTGIYGISLGTLSNTAYSDYRDNRYVAKSYMSDQVSALLKSVPKSGLGLAVSDANDYAAYRANHIFDAPTVSAKYQLFDCDIPFYEIVFKGYTSMSVISLNISDNEQEMRLSAIESGIGFGYTVISDYDTLLINSNRNLFYNSRYSDIKNKISENVLEYRDLFESVKGQTITKHTVINKAVRITEYSNGVRACVNYGDTDVQIEGKTVKSKGFAVLEGW